MNKFSPSFSPGSSSDSNSTSASLLTILEEGGVVVFLFFLAGSKGFDGMDGRPGGSLSDVSKYFAVVPSSSASFPSFIVSGKLNYSIMHKLISATYLNKACS